MREQRAANELRPITIDTQFNAYAEGSALISFGNTRVLCTASILDSQAPFLRGTNKGWVTAEYGMLPRATHTRGIREAAKGKQTGRTVEIQRLIGRSLRAVIDLNMLGPRSIQVDCDVLQADGGTRTAAITGAWIAMRRAVNTLLEQGVLEHDPIHDQVAAISCGYVDGEALLDLEYTEDSRAQMDANFIMTPNGGIIELQATAEDKPLPWEQVMALKQMADQGIATLSRLQLDAVQG